MGELADEPEETFTAQYDFVSSLYCTLFTTFGRQRREHRVFTALLKAAPGLEERLMTGTEEDIHFISTMVSQIIRYPLHFLRHLFASCKKVHQVRDPTIPRASSLQLLIGCHLPMNLLFLLLHGT